MTDIQDVVQTVDPFSVQVFNDTMLQVSSRFDNSQVTGAYFIQTIGLFAKLGDGDPILFEVAQAITPDEMPAQSAVAPSAFVYNMQVAIQQASQLTVTVNPAGTATVQDILTLNATKVDIDGGDISNTIAATFEASNASWPIPAAGETLKVILGKIKKHLEDLANWRPTVSLVSDIVNNLTSTATDKPLSANQGKVLQDQITQVNSDMKNYYSLSGGIRIPDNADLKSAQYLIPGNYFCNNNTSAESLRNCPFTSAFLLKVEYSTGGTIDAYVRQIFKRYSDGAIISRIYFSDSSSWGEDVQYAIIADVNKVPDSFEIEQRYATISMSNEYGEATISCSKAGYKCLGMVGYQINNTYCYMYMALHDSNTENIKIGIRGTTSQNPTVYVRLLYIRENVV